MFNTGLINSGIYEGTITEVLPPGHEENDTENYQYVYFVEVSVGNMCLIPVKCVRMDSVGGNLFNYEDVILPPYTQVYVAFPWEDTSRGIVLGGTRSVPEEPQEDEGIVRWKKRFNQINQSISADGVWKLEHTSQTFPTGPSITLDKSSILIDDGGTGSQGTLNQSIKIDNVSKTIEISTGEWTISALKGVTINVTGGDINLSCTNAKVEAAQAKVTCQAGVDIDGGLGAVNVKSINKVTVQAPMVDLGQTPIGNVITTVTQPTCYVTGIPFNGSPVIKAG